MHKSLNRYPIKMQNGVVLIVALILVLVSSLLGISTMKSSRVESQLTNNMLFEQTTFRAAESAVDSLLTTNNIFAITADMDSTIDSNQSVVSEVAVMATFESHGISPVLGYSLGGRNAFQNTKFIAKANASIDSANSASEIIVGIKRLTVAQR